jgi:hypothetical protein
MKAKFKPVDEVEQNFGLTLADYLGSLDLDSTTTIKTKTGVDKKAQTQEEASFVPVEPAITTIREIQDIICNLDEERQITLMDWLFLYLAIARGIPFHWKP